MNINLRKLGHAGLTVRVYDTMGLVEKHKIERIEIFPENTVPFDSKTVEGIREHLGNAAYQQVVIEELINRILIFQVLEAIEATGRED